MVHVQLEDNWTDSSGRRYAAGETVDVDAATLAALQATGVAADPDGGGGDDDDGGGGAGTESWPGPTDGGGAETESWPGPTDGGNDE